jgi:hypothetical protein
MHAGHVAPPVHTAASKLTAQYDATVVTIEQMPAPDPVIELACTWLQANAVRAADRAQGGVGGDSWYNHSSGGEREKVAARRGGVST